MTVVRLAVAVVLLQACSTPVAPSGSTAGSVALSLSAAGTVKTIKYAVTGNGLSPLSGTIPVDAGATVSLLIDGLPAGTGYRVTLDGVSDDGATTCHGTADFAIVAGQTTAVTVPLSCRTASNRGAVAIDTVLATCPRITMTSAAPQRATVGAAIGVAAQATGSTSLAWSSSGGAFADPASASTNFFCSVEGDQTLTVTAQGDHCSDSASLTVHCDSLAAVGSAAPCLRGGNVLFIAGNDSIVDGTEVLRGRWRVQGDAHHSLQLGLVPVGRPDTSWALHFDSGAGDLAPGVYGNARSPTPPPGRPVLAVSSDQRSCLRTFGNFQIETLEGDLANPSAFTATFEQHCEGAATSIQGCLHYEAAPRQSDACLACQQSHLPDCEPNIGCEHLTEAADRALCEALDHCLVSSNCWRNDSFNDCVCGKAPGAACLVPGAADGVCLPEAMAATRARDIVDVGVRYFDFAYPAAYAAARLACDRDFCTSDAAGFPDTCGTSSDCPDDGNPCTREVLNGGVCQHVLAADGTRCSDGNACTQMDVCQGGACRGTEPVQCGVPVPSSCTTGGTCYSSSGLCLGAVPKPDGTPCDDGVKCTDDACRGGACRSSRRQCPSGQTCVESSGGCQTLDACSACEQQNVTDGLCNLSLGCDTITTGAADVALCEALDGCMRRTGCWKHDPVDCLCGGADSFHCLGGAGDGVCKAETVAATKGVEPPDVLTRFFDTAYPSGAATQRFACDHDYCFSACSP